MKIVVYTVKITVIEIFKMGRMRPRKDEGDLIIPLGCVSCGLIDLKVCW